MKELQLDKEWQEHFLCFKWDIINGKYFCRNVWDHNKRRYFTSYPHREIVGAIKGQYVDHKDGDTFNNLKSNLRICTQSQNLGNTRKTTSKTISKYKGVSYRADKKKWRAYLGKTHLGYFNSELEAVDAYNEAAAEKFGEFALLNKVVA